MPDEDGGSALVFLQANLDPRQVFAVVERGGEFIAYGPLGAGEVFTWDRWQLAARGEGDRELAAYLRGSGDFHDLEDYFHHFGNDELASWVASSPRETDFSATMGRTFEDVAERLALEGTARQALWDAALDETVSDRPDPAGDPLYFSNFSLGNWAIDAGCGGLRIDPINYRFKAWLSFHT